MGLTKGEATATRYDWPITPGHDEILEIVLNEDALDLTDVRFRSQVRSLPNHLIAGATVIDVPLDIDIAGKIVTARIPRAVTATMKNGMTWSLAWSFDTDADDTLDVDEDFYDLIAGSITLDYSPTEAG